MDWGQKDRDGGILDFGLGLIRQRQSDFRLLILDFRLGEQKPGSSEREFSNVVQSEI